MRMDLPMASDVMMIHPADTVAVALEAMKAGTALSVSGRDILLVDDVPKGHKIALRAIERGEEVRKYGHVIGRASCPIVPGAWVHAHNLMTTLDGKSEYTYAPGTQSNTAHETPLPTFEGYRRTDGRVGTRNEIWIITTVGCVNPSAERIARLANERHRRTSHFDGVWAFAHPFGCSQLGGDLEKTRALLRGLVHHPNAGGVLVLGLGCENNQLKEFLSGIDPARMERVRAVNAQETEDEVACGLELIGELAGLMQHDRREQVPVSELVLGMKCGGSDGFSGMTANPLVGRITDCLTDAGGRVILTEVPEMFGAEQQLMNRALNEKVYGDIVGLINDFKDYFLRHGQPVYENPSPGNKAGGITTLEEKSLGAVQKGGSARVAEVLAYGEPVGARGMALLDAPGNDAVSGTALTASGATMILFTTGRGTPLGFPAPTVKISTNSALKRSKPAWIDFDAGVLAEGAGSMDALAQELLGFLLEAASGRIRTQNELNGYREIAIWKEGVTL